MTEQTPAPDRAADWATLLQLTPAAMAREILDTRLRSMSKIHHIADVTADTLLHLQPVVEITDWPDKERLYDAMGAAETEVREMADQLASMITATRQEIEELEP